MLTLRKQQEARRVQDPAEREFVLMSGSHGSLGGSEYVDAKKHKTSTPGDGKAKLTKDQRAEFAKINKNLQDLKSDD